MKAEDITVRVGTEADLAAISRILAASPEAARWSDARFCLGYDFRVAVLRGRVAGLLVLRRSAAGESEILNLAVDPGQRRKGVGRKLLERVLPLYPGDMFLEVRESNAAARKFYQVLGFEEVGRRSGYYRSPTEGAVVMKFHSCYCHSR